MTEQFKQKVFLGVVALGPGLFLVEHPVMWLLGWCLPGISLNLYALAKERTRYTPYWAALGWLPFYGPPFALAALGLNHLLSKWSTPRLVRRLAVSIVALCGPALFLAILIIPNHHRHPRYLEATTNLGGIFVAETAFLGNVGRYGTFDEVGYTLPDHTTRYTYRIDNSGKPGTVFPAKDGTLTPDNTIVHAGISPDGQHFTATATANLDDDPTLDQWHVNDIKQNLRRADVSDTRD